MIESLFKRGIAEEEAQKLGVDAAEQNRMMEARFRNFHFPRSLSKDEKVEVPACTACFSKWVLGSQPSQPPQRLPGGSRATATTPATPPTPSSRMAAEAILDWMETHGGKVVLAGPSANVGALADALAWPQSFLAACGRLVPFLRTHGRACPEQANVVVDFALPP